MLINCVGNWDPFRQAWSRIWLRSDTGKNEKRVVVSYLAKNKNVGPKKINVTAE